MRNGLREWYEGSITVTIRGKRFERLINLAVRDGLQIWNIQRLGSDAGRFDILIRDYFRLRPLLKETGCRSHVEKRTGLPFWVVRMRMRAGFTAGVMLFFIGLYMLSSFVWTVEVQGTHNISTYEIKKAAESVGVKPGAWKLRLKEPISLQQELLSKIPGASWVAVQIDGTKAIIQVVEKEVHEKQAAEGPRHLIAKKKAVVHSIFAESGKSIVSINQFVNKGQVLISGIIGKDDRLALVPAKGSVEGEVWYVSDVTVPLTRTRYAYTGESVSQHYLLAGPYAIQLWPFEKHTLKRFEKQEKRFQPSYKEFSLPVGWRTETLREMQPVVQKITRDEAIDIGKKFASQDVLKQAGKNASIREEKVLHAKEENGKVYLRIHYTVIEEIAEEQPIVSLPPAPSKDKQKPN